MRLTAEQMNRLRYEETAMPRRKNINQTMLDYSKKQQADLRKALRALKVAKGLLRDAGVTEYDCIAMETFQRLCRELGI